MSSGAGFIHEHGDFEDLLAIVSTVRGTSAALVEKDYWVTHTLWALLQAGLQVHFKGGTSLSKGFGLIERFSEDLDLKLEAPDLPPVSSWSSEGITATRGRREYFEALEARLEVPGADIEELPELRDRAWRSAVFAVRYPSRASDDLPSGLRPFVQLEVGSARMTPGEERAISSWVHDHIFTELPELAATFVANRPTAVHVVSPGVTLLEKVEAISRRFSREPLEPGTFVRHYEDVARILAFAGLDRTELSRLLRDMIEQGEIREWPGTDGAAWNPNAEAGRWNELERAWELSGSIFWGRRIPLSECADAIRGLLEELPRPNPR